MKNVKDKDNLSNLVTKYKDPKYKEDHEEDLNNLRNENDQLKSELSKFNKMLNEKKIISKKNQKIIMEK